MRVAPAEPLQFVQDAPAGGEDGSSPSSHPRTSSMRELVASSFPAHFDLGDSPGSPQVHSTMRHSIANDTRHDEAGVDFTPEFAARLTRRFPRRF